MHVTEVAWAVGTTPDVSVSVAMKPTTAIASTDTIFPIRMPRCLDMLVLLMELRVDQTIFAAIRGLARSKGFAGLSLRAIVASAETSGADDRSLWPSNALQRDGHPCARLSRIQPPRSSAITL